MLHLIFAGLVTVTVSPMVCHEPCQLIVRIKVEPARDNHVVVLQIDGESFSSSTQLNVAPSCYDKDGKEVCNYPPSTTQIRFPKVPGGDYVVAAVLIKHDGKTWEAGHDAKRVKVVSTD